MTAELVELRARVERLERALAAARTSRPPVRQTTTIARATIPIAATAAVVGAIALSTATSMRAAGPTKVTAPFSVVDDAGRVLVEVQATQGGGRLVVYNSSQDRIAEIEASDNSRVGRMRVYLAGETKPKVMLGVNLDDTGGLELAGLDGGFAQMSGRGVVLANRDRQVVAPKEFKSIIGALTGGRSGLVAGVVDTAIQIRWRGGFRALSDGALVGGAVAANLDGQPGMPKRVVGRIDGGPWHEASQTSIAFTAVKKDVAITIDTEPMLSAEQVELRRRLVARAIEAVAAK